eukprot:8771695-Pyramimonas_sp.AAC.1
MAYRNAGRMTCSTSFTFWATVPPYPAITSASSLTFVNVVPHWSLQSSSKFTRTPRIGMSRRGVYEGRTCHPPSVSPVWAPRAVHVVHHPACTR